MKKIEQEGELKNYKRKKRSSETEDQRNSAWPLKILKRKDENELARKLRWSLANTLGWPWRRKRKTGK